MTQTRNPAPVRRGIALGAVAVVVGTAALAMPASTAWAGAGDGPSEPASASAAASLPGSGPGSGSASGSGPGSGSGFDRKDLQRGLDDIVRHDGVVGAQATLVEGAERSYARSGTARLGGDRPMPHQGYLRMGSNTKTFVSTVVLQLVGEGRMRLDDTVERWLPGLVGGNGHDGARITVRQLLQHTSGLPDYAPHLPILDEKQFLEKRYDDFRPEQLVALALRERPLFEPGASHRYSNTGYILAGMIIEKVTGNHWSQEVHDRVIEPLGLKHTFSPGSRTGLPKPHAKGYHQFKPGASLVDSTRVNMTWGGAAGDLVTTSNDLVRFWQGLLGGKLLKPAQLAQMRTTVDMPPDGRQVVEKAGLGIFWRSLSCGGGFWGHGGTTLGHLNANGFTDRGRRGAVVIRTTNVALDDRDARTDRLLDAALCGTRKG
ncbi:serine hydrolase domain-containing protein [Streptomyces sp. NPDC000594]|uniref:serine hydrolase domain-containing protein n=1 Tax=Streptomyces sp. NPDC000594 TaxID=3154261 RepID=UPI003331CA88